MSQLTTIIARYPGATHAVDQLHAEAVTLRNAAYTCDDAGLLPGLLSAWDVAERALGEAVGELLRLTIDGEQGDAPVAWTHRCAEIARIAGATEAQVDDICVSYDWGMGHAEQIAEINRMHDAALALWVSDVLGYELA